MYHKFVPGKCPEWVFSSTTIKKFSIPYPVHISVYLRLIESIRDQAMQLVLHSYYYNIILHDGI